MPDTFIIVGEYDPLVDESIAFANKLRHANVQVTEKVYRRDDTRFLSVLEA